MNHRYNTRFQKKKQQQERALRLKAEQFQSNQPQSKPVVFSSPPTREELLACTVPFPMKDALDSTRLLNGYLSTSSLYTAEELQEVNYIKQLLNKVTEEKNQIKKALCALKIYHFLEWNQKILKKNARFRNVVRAKAQEFIAVSKERTDMLTHIPSTSTNFTAVNDLAMVTEELKESAERVISILNTIETKPFSQ